MEGLPVFVIQLERIPASDWEPLREYLAETRPNLLQNAKFDLKMLAAEGLPLAGPVRDTLLRSKLLHLGTRRIRHGLKVLAKKWCDIELDKTQQTSFLGDESRSPLSLEQIIYAARDIASTAKVEVALRQPLQSRRNKRLEILKHVAREERFLPLLAQLENQGVLINLALVKQLADEIKARMETIEAELLPILRPNLKQLKLNLGRKLSFKPTQLPEAAIKKLFQVENLDTKKLLQLSYKQPLAKLVLEHAALWRQLDCCLELTQKQNPKTGRWHPDHSQIENLQGTLGPSKLKVELLERLTKGWWQEPVRLLKPEDGSCFLDVSLPLLELILLGHYSQDPQLLEALATGESPIDRLAEAIATTGVGTPYDNTVLANALWHGVGVLNQKGLYLQTWLLSEYSLILDPKQVKALQTLIPEQYPTLAAFQAMIKDLKYENRTTILGALRLWDQSSPRDVRSFLVKSSVSELLKECVSLLQPWCLATKSRVAFIGEQRFLLEVSAAQADVLADDVVTVLAEAIGQLCPQVAIEIEVSSLAK